MAAVLLTALLDRTVYLKFPFLAALTYASWYLPQVVPAVQHGDVPERGEQILLTMSFLCLAMILAGWTCGRRAGARAAAGGWGGRAAGPGRPPDPDIARFVWPVALLTVFAIGMELLIRDQPDDVRTGAWSGPITIMVFFRTCGKAAFAASMLMVLLRRTPATVLLAAANLALVAPSLFIAYRRIDTIDVVFALIAVPWVVRRWTLPRAAIVLLGVAGFFFVHAVGELRALGGAYTLDANGEITTHLPTWEEISQIDWFSSNPLAGGEIYEVENAATYMALATDGPLTMGGQFWNRLVFAYVPGQLIGVENKQALMIGVSLQDIAFSEMGYEWHVGTTSTGFVESYTDFWFFGSCVFFVVSFLLALQYEGMVRGDPFSAILYIGGMGIALHSITHGSYYYFTNVPIVAASVMFLRWSVRRRQAREAGPALLPVTPALVRA